MKNAYVSGYALPNPPSIRTGKKVAVIGSGPAGLAAADQLNKRGHSVTVFERNDRVGGLLMYGIPNMSWEKWVIERKADVMKKEGITFVTGADVGRNYRPAKSGRNLTASSWPAGPPTQGISTCRAGTVQAYTLRWIF